MNAEALLPRPIRVAIVDDTEDLRFLLRHALERGGMEVVAEAGDGRAGDRGGARDAARRRAPRPGDAGPRRARGAAAHAARGARARIIVLSGFGADLLSDELLALGADGYIEKGHSVSRIVQYVEECVTAPAYPRPPCAVLRLVR